MNFNFYIESFIILEFIYSCGNMNENKSSADNTVCGYHVQLADSNKTETYMAKTYWFYTNSDNKNMTTHNEKQVGHEKNHHYIDFSLDVTARNNGNVSLRTNYRRFAIPNATDQKVNFGEQIRIVNSFMKKYFKQEKIRRVKSINIPLLFAADINGEVTNKFCSGKGGRGRLEEIVQKSKMGQALDSIFFPYGLCVKKVCIEKFYLTGKSIVKEQNIPASDYAKLPDKLVYGYAGFILAKRE